MRHATMPTVLAILLGSCVEVGTPDEHRPLEGAGDPVAKVDLATGELALVPQDDAELAELGARAGAAGDLDGDGTMDLVLGAPGDSTLATEAGAVFVRYGSTSAPLDDGTEQVLRASDGSEDARLGDAVAGAGDLDGDGFDDVVAGAWGESSEATDAGAAYVWYGSATGLVAASEQKLTDPDPGVFDYLGYAVDGAGDVDGDGHDDLVLGAGLSREAAVGGGTAWMVYGSSTGAAAASATELWPSDIARYDRFGQAVAGAGDVDGDGYADVVIGARTADVGGVENAGAAYLYLGSATGLDLSSEQKLTASSPVAAAQLGTAVAAAGDVDGDGYGDLLLGGPGGAGTAWVVFGAATGAGSVGALTASDASTGDAFGSALAGLGDLDGDGYDDLAVGAPGRTGSASGDGAVYVYYGSPKGPAAKTQQILTATGTRAGDALGSAVVGPGDVDGDGFPDVVGGAEGRHQAGAGTVGGATAWVNGCVDADGDGTCAVSDCDDDDATVGPGSVWYVDVDGDGFGDPATASASVSCTGPADQVSTGGDCDDLDPDINPGVAEIVADGIDQDCDDQETCYADADGDGVRAMDGSTVLSTDTDCSDDGEAIASSPASDCDDTDPAVRPGAEEVVGDGIDQDCDGQEECYLDADGDGHRPDATSTVASEDADCDDMGEATAEAPVDDCDDSEPTAWEGAEEIPGDEVDQDCDGREVCYLDADDDGFIAEGGLTLASEDLDCTDLGEGLDNDPRGDCDDNRASTHPGAEETCNGVDDDCDGFVDGTEATGFGIWERDADGDGYTVSSATASGCEPPDGYASPSEPEDCNDANPDVYPGAEEIPNDGTDQDCDQTDLRKGCGCAAAPGGGMGDGAGGLALLGLTLIGVARRRWPEPTRSASR